MITQEQALAGLGALVGGGGLSAILVSFFGYLTEARKGRKPPADVTVAIGANLNAEKWAELSASHLAAIAHALQRGAAILEIEAEERFEGRDFHERLETKLWHMLRPREGPRAP